MNELQKKGRLAMRVQGDLWCAYYVLPDTVGGALFLGSIRLQFVEDAERKLVFMALIKEAVGDIFLGKHEPPKPGPRGEECND